MKNLNTLKPGLSSNANVEYTPYLWFQILGLLVEPMTFSQLKIKKYLLSFYRKRIELAFQWWVKCSIRTNMAAVSVIYFVCEISASKVDFSKNLGT